MSEPSPRPTAVAVVEDDTRYRNFLRTLLEEAPGFRCAGAYSSVEAALPLIASEPPDLLLLDLQLPGMPGEQSIAEFRRLLPRLEVVVLTFHQDPHRLFPCLEAGAVGYLIKPIGPADLMMALQEVREGGSPMSGPIARLVLRSFQKQGTSRSELESLTSRELEVLREIAAGSVPKEVAITLGIALRTVQTHLRNIYEKLHVHSRSQAVACYLKGRSGEGRAGSATEV